MDLTNPSNYTQMYSIKYALILYAQPVNNNLSYYKVIEIYVLVLILYFKIVG